MKPVPIPYWGGKSSLAPHGMPQWIVGLLPAPERDQHYVEPFAGMCGVLLEREPVKCETINDVDERIIGWWRTVADEKLWPLLHRRLSCTPRSRSEYLRAISLTDSADPVESAWAVTVRLTQGLRCSLLDDGAETAWRRMLNTSVGGVRPRPTSIADRLPALCARMEGVQIECRDAVQLLRETASHPCMVIYADPPYWSAEGGDLYAEGRGGLDLDALTEALLAQTGRVAVSGYGTEWDHLGWERHTRDVQSHGCTGVNSRTEVLWTNYTPERGVRVQQASIFDHQEATDD